VTDTPEQLDSRFRGWLARIATAAGDVQYLRSLALMGIEGRDPWKGETVVLALSPDPNEIASRALDELSCYVRHDKDCHYRAAEYDHVGTQQVSERPCSCGLHEILNTLRLVVDGPQTRKFT
jgi:hypothetical protein